MSTQIKVVSTISRTEISRRLSQVHIWMNRFGFAKDTKYTADKIVAKVVTGLTCSAQVSLDGNTCTILLSAHLTKWQMVSSLCHELCHTQQVVSEEERRAYVGCTAGMQYFSQRIEHEAYIIGELCHLGERFGVTATKDAYTAARRSGCDRLIAVLTAKLNMIAAAGDIAPSSSTLGSVTAQSLKKAIRA